MSELLLGIDVGTTSTKAVLARPSGEVVAQASRPHPTQHPRPGWAEQRPEDWWQGAAGATREVLERAGAGGRQVAGIAVSGQGCAVTLLDGAGKVVRPAIIWMDTRAEPQCEHLRQTCGEQILRLNGKQPAPYNADPSLMWLNQHEPDAIAAAQVSLTSTGYLTYRLTGRPVSNRSDSSILFAYDLAKGRWSDDLIAAFGLPRRLYPELADCAEVVGGLCPEAASVMSLEPGTPVAAGGEDTSSAALALGVASAGQVSLSVGTAGTVNLATSEPLVHPSLLTFAHVLPGLYLIGGSTNAVGAALSWAKGALGIADDAQLNALAAQAAPGAGGAVFLPYLSGELQPINDGNAKGVFFGLTQATGRAELARAVFEGTVFALAHNLALVGELGLAADELLATGGPSGSALWCQTVADVTGHGVTVHAGGGAPLGDALLAGKGVGLVPDLLEAARSLGGDGQTYQPNAANHAMYADRLELYRQLYPALRPAFAR